VARNNNDLMGKAVFSMLEVDKPNRHFYGSIKDIHH
jgi:hypothetical protein